MSVKSKHSTTKKDKNGKKEKKKKLEVSDEEIESSEEELDLTKECHPIGYYINDRAEMINQMFSVIKGNKLKAMLPPTLKDYNLDQLKLQCLDQLLGMSEKRITCILEGGVLESSSESEVADSDDYDSDEKNKTSSSSSSDGSGGMNYGKHESGKRKKRKGGSVSDGKAGKVAKTNDETAPPEQGKTLLEILELEMRARAIRALLKQSGSEKGQDQDGDEVSSGVAAESSNKNGIRQEVTGEVVDLTGGEDDEFSAVSVKKEASASETDVDRKESNFESKIEKSKSDKGASAAAAAGGKVSDEKTRKLQAELELRNKLFKKKIYRTRQQRMENEEEKPASEAEPVPASLEVQAPAEGMGLADVVVKQEPVEPDEIVVEDPEEGEISTSEDEYPVEIKQEPEDVPEEPLEPTPDPEDFEAKIHEDGERVTAIDNGTFLSNCNLELPEHKTTEDGDDVVQVECPETQAEPEVDSQTGEGEEDGDSRGVTEKPETEDPENGAGLEETSWRHRWLQKDGVQKLVKSSKILAKVKKRIAEKSQRVKEDTAVAAEVKSGSVDNSKPVEVIEGSIEEYERLLGRTQDQQKNESETCPNGNAQPGEAQ